LTSGAAMFNTAIFLGPSLDTASARSILKARYLPPIKRGDLSQLGCEIETVGIIDGEFYQSLAVSPKEVLQLLNRGIKVYGSSSIGALRAAETHVYGMIGVGEIFELYRDGLIDGDDEVALIYDPDTYRSLSEPLVNIRFALKTAVLEGLIDSSKADEIVKEIKNIYFPSRSYRAVSERCPGLRDFLYQRRPDQKREDAALLLHTISNAANRVLPGAEFTT
jgi:hypothetical protein